MDQIDESLKKQIAALLRVVHVTRLSKEDNVPCQIEEGLFLGSIGAANNKEELKNLNITHILTVANSLAPAYPNDFVYKVINVADRVCTDLKQHFDECIDYIDVAKRSGGGVLVHCFVGRSRRMTRSSQPTATPSIDPPLVVEAIDQVDPFAADRGKRPIIEPEATSETPIHSQDNDLGIPSQEATSAFVPSYSFHRKFYALKGVIYISWPPQWPSNVDNLHWSRELRSSLKHWAQPLSSLGSSNEFGNMAEVSSRQV
ncbi:hypothetical protein C1H46_024148 [Malus baccata]|uniref:protein-tyrosine-phosphatase n=1 Tax=Malus baccata TaxID=106549 RepID=A0A540LUZ7_MALBA|nr:hypothetical protein C1H46_024148 [Malus baccata]